MLCVQNKPDDAIKIYDKVQYNLKNRSPRAVFGKATAIDKKSELQKSNTLLGRLALIMTYTGICLPVGVIS